MAQQPATVNESSLPLAPPGCWDRLQMDGSLPTCPRASFCAHPLQGAREGRQLLVPSYQAALT